MADRAYTWNKSAGGTGNWNLPANWDLDDGYPGDGGGYDSVTFPTGMEPCTVNAAVTIKDFTLNSDHSGADVMMTANMTCTGNVLITQGELQTGDYNFKVTGSTDIYGTLTPGASTCYFGYGGAGTANWDLGVRGTGVLNAGTGDWYCGGTGFYSGADVSLTSGIMYISGTAFGYLWSPDQGVGAWDNRDGTVILQSTGQIRTEANSFPLTASDTAICPFHTLIISGGHDRTDAPVVTLQRAMKIDDELIIKNGVLKWDTYAGSYGDVWAVQGTELIGLASQSAAIVFDDMPARSAYYSATGSSPTGDGFQMGGNAIVSGATAKLEVGSVMLQSDAGNSNLPANQTITGLNGTPYFHFPSGEACAVFDGYVGTKHNIEVPYDASINLTDIITISVWIKPNIITNISGNPIYIMTRGDSTYSSNGDKTYELALYDSKIRFRSTGTTIINAAVPPVAGTWQHIGIVFDKDAVGDYDTLLYFNGVLAASGNFGSALDSNTDAGLTIGSNTGGLSAPFDGGIADLRIYSVVKDADDMVAFAATNPATSVTGTYPTTGAGLKAWWQLQPYQILTGSGSGDLDVTDSSSESNNGTDNGAFTGWGGLWLNNNGAGTYILRTYQRNYLTNNTSALGVEGRGSTVYMTPRASDMNFANSDGGWYDAVTQYNNGQAFKFNNLNINKGTAGNGEVRIVSNRTNSGLLDFTGDLFIASGATFYSYWTGTNPVQKEKADMASGDIYVSGNMLIFGTEDLSVASFVTAVEDGFVARMPQLLVGALTLAGDGTYNATPYYTILSGNVGSKNVEGYNWTPIYQYGTATLTHNSGTFWNKSNKGYVGYKQAGGDLGPYYNYIQDFDEEPQHVQNTNLKMLGDFTLSGAATEGSKGAWGLRNESTYSLNVSGNMILKDGGCFGCPNQDGTGRFNVGKNLELGSGSRLVLPNADNDATVAIGGSLFNRGGLIYDGDVS